MNDDAAGGSAFQQFECDRHVVHVCQWHRRARLLKSMANLRAVTREDALYSARIGRAVRVTRWREHRRSPRQSPAWARGSTYLKCQ